MLIFPNWLLYFLWATFSVNGRDYEWLLINCRGLPHLIHGCTACGQLFLRLYGAKVILANFGRQLLMVGKFNFTTFSHEIFSLSKESLFTSSHERKYVGFQLLETILPSLSVREVPLVFSPNLLRCLMNNASSPENYLHPAAKHLVSWWNFVLSMCGLSLCLSPYLSLSLSPYS